MSGMNETKNLLDKLELIEYKNNSEETQVHMFKNLIENVVQMGIKSGSNKSNSGASGIKSKSQESLESGYIGDENSNSSSILLNNELSNRQQIQNDTYDYDYSNDVFAFQEDQNEISSSSSSKYYCDDINDDEDNFVETKIQRPLRDMSSSISQKIYSCSLPRDIPINSKLFSLPIQTTTNTNNNEQEEIDNNNTDTATTTTVNSTTISGSLHLGHAIAQLASSIVQKDGTELFGDRPSRRIPINSISKSCCYD